MVETPYWITLLCDGDKKTYSESLRFAGSLFTIEDAIKADTTKRYEKTSETTEAKE